MKFSEIVDHASKLLRQKGRVTYRALKLEFALTDEQAEALKEELIEAREVVTDKDGKMLVWRGTPREQPAGSPQRPQAEAPQPQRALPTEAERHSSLRAAPPCTFGFRQNRKRAAMRWRAVILIQASSAAKCSGRMAVPPIHSAGGHLDELLHAAA
jgi:hypothetical protein